MSRPSPRVTAPSPSPFAAPWEAQVFALVPPAIRGLGQSDGFTMELQNTGGLTQEQFDAECADIAKRIGRRMVLYESGLRGAQALFFPVFEAHEPSCRLAAKLGGTRSNAELH